jgi:anaerobic magnesium-protoporphyrin IX monomethyl ester cyclase
MRVVLADVKAREGFAHKDTVVGGYGARMRPFSTVTKWACAIRKRINDVPSVTMATLGAILDDAGHEVLWTRGPVVEADVALVLSSLVDHKNETRFADAMRAKGAKVGFVGLAASKMPFLFQDHADFLIYGEPEEAVKRMAGGETLSGFCQSREIADLAEIPFPRWDLVGVTGERRASAGIFTRPIGGFPVLASRSCPEFCTYCPHRILTRYRGRSVESIANELEYLCTRYERPFIIFRDPLFTQERDRVMALCDEILARGMDLRFECETRLDRLDEELLTKLKAAGLEAIEFGVESVSPEVLKKVGRRPIPEDQQRMVIKTCDRLGIRTVGFYVLGFNTDTWDSIAATIEYSISLGSTLAQFKLLTPYPGTPLWKHMEAQVFEKDWERFDGFSVTFHHPNLSPAELQFLLAAAYARFYLRPSFFANLWRFEKQWVRSVVSQLDQSVAGMHAWREVNAMSRAVEC